MTISSAPCRALLFAALAAVALLTAQSARTEDGAAEAEQVVFDRWYASFHNGKKAGWTHTRRVRTTLAATPVWITETSGRSLFIGGDPDSGRMESSSRYVEDAAGRVLAFRTSMDIGMESGPQVYEGTLADGVITAVLNGASREVPYPEGALGPAALDRTVLADLTPGVQGDAVGFDASKAAGSNVSWKIEKMTKMVDVLGRWMWLTKVVRKENDGLEEVSYVGPGAAEYASSFMLGMWSYFLTEEVVARSDAEPATHVTSRVIAVDRATTLSPRPVRLRWRLSRESGPVGKLPEGVGQTVVARPEDGSAVVEVTFTEPRSGTALARPYAGEEDMQKYLAATPLVELSNDRLQRYSKNIVGELINSIRSARMVELRVKQYIHPAPTNVGFATACEAISSSTGDSTEAAALAVGFARSAGLPARLVSGFIYWGPESWPGERYPHGAFAPHTWVEIYVAEGVWLPIDPMRMDGTEPEKSVDDLEGHGGFDATHIAVLRSDLDTTQPFTDIVKPVLEFMDGLKIEVADEE